MNKEENNFEEFLRAKLENHSVEVSDSVWAAIENKQKKREKLIWFKQYLNVFLALDIVFVLGFTAFTMLNSNDVQSKNKVNTYAQIKQETEAIDLSSSIKEIDNKPNKHRSSKQNIANNTAPLVKESQAEITITKAKKLPIKTTKEIANRAMLANENKSIASHKTSKNSNEKTAIVLVKQPLHTEILDQNTSSITPVYANLKPMALRSLTREKYNHYTINQSKQDIEFLPPSIAQSKSKKVLKAEQKAIEKVNKAIAKEEKVAQKALEKQAATEAEKAEQQNKMEVVAEPGENDIAPLALDTVYGKKKFKGFFAIDALVSPDIAGRALKGNNEQVNNYISRRDSAEKLQLSYSALMRINLFINRNVFINTGISFSQRKEKFSIEHKWETIEDYIDSSKFITIIDPFEGNTIYKTYDTLDYVRTQKEVLNHHLTMTFVDIPAMIGYKWLGKKAGIAVQGGVIFNLLFKQKGSLADFTYTANDINQASQNPFNTNAGLSIAGGLSSNYKLSDKLDLLIEPHTRYILKPINNSAYPLQQKLFTYGLNVGIRLKL